MSGAARERTARRALEAALAAISRRDVGGLAALLDPEAIVTTGRGEHRGADAVLAWVARRYDHLERVYRVEEVLPAQRGNLARGRVEYRWREGDELADASPIWLTFALRGERLLELGLHDDEDEARAVADA